ncbi:MAG TPA: serine--tRNA ligase [Candidatus Saccharimonadales bacterium]|nr:serine--tRNA ligase [Candidatus Saccharimonadales bacterium]
MLDIRFVREHAEAVQENARRKGYDVKVDELLKWDQNKRQLQQQADELREKRNTISSQMKGGRPSDELVAEGKVLKEQLAEVEAHLKEADETFTELLKKIPNMALADVPVGASEDENVVAKTVGEPTVFDFIPKNHAELAELKGWLDKERAAKVTGSRFAYLKGDLVKLQFALIQFVMDKLSDQTFIDEVIRENNLSVSNKPFLPILPPFMLRTQMYDAMDRLEPRDDRYKIEDEDLWLQGSAEHVLGSMHADEIFDKKELPIRYIGYATSFRREAGTYGKDMEGMFRMHQFDKLEMESLGASEAGLEEHLFLVAIQEKIMQLLEIPYRVLLKCTADIGKPNARGVDIDAWLPGQNNYRETHTADYMTDYQARRLKTRLRRENGEVELIHTNDATALPLSRGPIAILENHQRADGSITIPSALRPYLGGREIL